MLPDIERVLGEHDQPVCEHLGYRYPNRIAVEIYPDQRSYDATQPETAPRLQTVMRLYYGRNLRSLVAGIL